MKKIYSTAIVSIRADQLNKGEIQKKSLLMLLGMVSTFLVCVGNNPQDTGKAAPELVFIKPVLVSGKANSEGAIYRFGNVTPGVDAEIKLKKFSRKEIVMTNIDLPDLGWGKAFQPQFGLPGYVNPNQHWYIDFECIFYAAGTNRRQKMQKFDLTSLDVDGDGVTIAEYILMEKPNSVAYSTITSLVTGVPDPEMECGTCSQVSTLSTCTSCNGSGRNGAVVCSKCNGAGKLHNGCNHPWDGLTNQFVQGTVLNFANIDTAATQVMATYTYLNKDRINFRMGATSGTRGSNGAGIRLNSLWFRSFSLATHSSLLPVRLIDFSATYIKDQVNLKWASAQQKQFNHFVVEKSFDGKNFNEVSLVFSDEKEFNSTQYTAIDPAVETGNNIIFYRLKMIDTDSHITYSPIRIVRLPKEEEYQSVLTYPNPTVNEVRITVPAGWQNSHLTITIYNQYGQRLKQITRTSASQTESIIVSDLQPGIFMIKVASSTKQVSRSFIKI